jgi:hypothetical protein
MHRTNPNTRVAIEVMKEENPRNDPILFAIRFTPNAIATATMKISSKFDFSTSSPDKTPLRDLLIPTPFLTPLELLLVIVHPFFSLFSGVCPHSTVPDDTPKSQQTDQTTL